MKNRMKWDDALDVWGVHGMGGALGSILLGALADESVGGVAAGGELVGKQILATAIAAVYSYLATVLILLLCGLLFRLKPNINEVDSSVRPFSSVQPAPSLSLTN